jgi:DNA-binding PadR family transcriptional regulator
MVTEIPLTDAELVVLSLICEEPLHGYRIEQQITQRNMRAWTDLSTSSIYYILQRLEKKGFIEQAATEISEKGVPRKIYRITPTGEKTWKAATLRALSHPKITYTSFLMGLHNLWNIPPGEALDAVRTYRDWLEKDLQRQRDELEDLGVSFFPLDVLFEYGFVLGDAELSFLAGLITRLEEMESESGSGIETA